ncbi:hypothetical protein DEO72_LG10g3273 [Vigna unguiculata]|uniref:Uncharacterized protein n=1 Tax=Vigna unguiculata TaxID=3917 RepID=A0A4D6NH76_VIGUN|nr:hypothetical protein DEO72_LG10g3273 [Vigna unguiculata]
MASREVTVINSSYRDPYSETRLQINTDTGVAYSENGGGRLFYIDQTSLSLRNRRVLYDDTQKPIVTFYSKIMRPQGRCKVFRGKNNDPSEFLFSVKKARDSATDTTVLNVLLANNQNQRKNDYRVFISGNKNSCKVYLGEYIDESYMVAKV